MAKYKAPVVTNNIDLHQAELTDRLAHYNAWLMDNTRDFGSTYPGYPGDKAKAKKKPADRVTSIVKPVKPPKGKGKSVMKIETVGVKVATIARGPKTGTKQARAVELLKGVAFVTKADKASAIEILVKELGMSKAGATTYAYNAQKLLAQPAVTA